MIQVFVEALDRCFENVCELDLIFHSDKVLYILDEVVMGGLVLETNLPEIIAAIEEQNKLERCGRCPLACCLPFSSPLKFIPSWPLTSCLGRTIHLRKFPKLSKTFVAKSLPPCPFPYSTSVDSCAYCKTCRESDSLYIESCLRTHCRRIR